LDTAAKRWVTSWVKACSNVLNGKHNTVNLNRLPSGSYDILVSMGWLERDKALINFLEKIVTCVTESGENQVIRCIPRPISISQIITLQLR